MRNKIDNCFLFISSCNCTFIARLIFGRKTRTASSENKSESDPDLPHFEIENVLLKNIFVANESGISIDQNISAEFHVCQGRGKKEAREKCRSSTGVACHRKAINYSSTVGCVHIKLVVTFLPSILLKRFSANFAAFCLQVFFNTKNSQFH